MDQIIIDACRDKLSPISAFILDGLEDICLAITGDDEINIAWQFGTEVPSDDLKQFLIDYTWPTNLLPQKYVEDPVVAGVKRSGIWRQATIKRLYQERKGRHLVILTLRKGWADELKWDEGRLFREWVAHANDEVIDDEDGTTTDNPHKIIMVRWNNLNPNKCDEIASTLLSVYDDGFVVDGNSYSGKWYMTVANPQRNSDESAFMDVVFSQGVYCLNGYDNSGTPREKQVGYLWNVPLAMAQDVMTGWKTNGMSRSAAASYGDTDKTVALVLTGVGAEAAQFCTNWIAITENAWRRWCFSFRTEEEDISTFLSSHGNDIIGTAVGNGGETARVVHTRSVSISQNSDGLFDVEVVETSYESKIVGGDFVADFILNVNIGTKIVRTEYWGYDIPKDEIDNLKTQLEAIKSVGYVVQIEFSKGKDDSTFNYHAVVTAQTGQIGVADGRIVSEIDVTGDDPDTGIPQKIVSMRGVDLNHPATLAAITDVFKASPRKKLSIDIRTRDDELSDISITEQEVQAAEDSASTEDTDGIVTRHYSGRNVDYGTVAGMIANGANDLKSAKRRQIDIGITPQDDGTVNYIIDVKDIVEVAETWDGEYGQYLFGNNADSVPAQPANTVIRFAQFSGNQDGTFNYTMGIVPLQVIAESFTSSRHRGKYRTILIGENADSVPPITDPTIGSAEVRSGENGKYNYRLVSENVNPEAITMDFRGGTMYFGAFQDALPSIAPDKMIQGSASFDEDGYLHYSLVVSSPVDTEASGLLSGTALFNIYQEVHSDGSAPAVVSPVIGQTYRLRLTPKDNGKFAWDRDLTEAVSYDAPGVVVNSSQYQETIYSGRNVQSIPNIPAYSADKDVVLSFRINDDKTIDYTLAVRDFSQNSLVQTGDLVVEDAVIHQKKEEIVYSGLSNNLSQVNVLTWHQKRTVRKLTRRYYDSHPFALNSSSFGGYSQVKVESRGWIRDGVFAVDVTGIDEEDWVNDTSYGNDGLKWVHAHVEE